MFKTFKNAKTKHGKVLGLTWDIIKIVCQVAFWITAGLVYMIFAMLFNSSDTPTEPKQKVKEVIRFIPIKDHSRW